MVTIERGPRYTCKTANQGAERFTNADTRSCLDLTARLHLEAVPPRWRLVLPRCLTSQSAPRASCFWVYAYPAFLRYAAHSAGGYWARILPQASEIAS